ncbi:MAG: hypothetical protein CMN32_14625, partial [Saprospirales bacterium]|nr:hypothetical protein [Saprospirales bacterium]
PLPSYTEDQRVDTEIHGVEVASASKPYTLNHTPYTLNSTPYSLLPTPSSIIAILLLSFVQSLSAQSDTLTLPEVQVSADKSVQVFSTAAIHRPDTALQLLNSMGTGAEVLPQMGFFLKTYGSGSLATSAFRGTGANHSTVVWNGFNIKNPMNGVIDYSLFPMGLSDDVALFDGGGSSLYGNGAIGGTLMLNDRLSFDEEFRTRLSLSGGSFSDYRQSAALHFAKKRTASNLKLWNQTARNDFPVEPDRHRQENAKLRHSGISQANRFRLNARNELGSFFWYQDVTRQIPPSRTEVNTHAQQDDQVLRAGVRWNNRQQSGMTTLQAGYFNERLLFFNDLIDSSRSQSHTWVADLKQQLYFGRNKLILKLQGQQQQASTRETGDQQRKTLAAVAGWKYYSTSEKSFLEVFLRQELVDGEAVPLTGSAGINWQVADNAVTTFRFSRSYNIPTFNDLYWQDGFAEGNPDLKPETGYGFEAGLRLSDEAFYVDLRLHSTTVANRILWVQFGGSWQPMNLDEVWSRGLSMKVGFDKSHQAWQYKNSFTVNFNRSSELGNYSAGKTEQLIYTPVITANYTIVAERGRNKAILQWNHTSRIYTTRYNNRKYSLDPFSIVNLHLVRHWDLGSIPLSTSFSANNLLNKDYEVIDSRPMPGRNFRVTVAVGL